MTTPQATFSYDPYVVQTLQTITGKSLVVETARGSIKGTLQEVKPDHIVLKTDDKLFYVRTAQIIWIMPI